MYLLRCADGTLYVGHTEDLAAHEKAHNEGDLPDRATMSPDGLGGVGVSSTLYWKRMRTGTPCGGCSSPRRCARCGAGGVKQASLLVHPDDIGFEQFIKTGASFLNQRFFKRQPSTP